MAAALLFTSCDKGDNSGNDNTKPEGPKPSIEVSNVKASATTVEFTLTPTNAIEYEYSVVPTGSEPEFTSVRGSKAKKYTIANLEQGTEYEITAFAYDSETQKSDEAKATVLIEATKTFPRMSVAYKFTGTWCVNCPSMTAMLDALIEEDPSSLAVVAIHSEGSSSSPFCSKGGNYLIDEWGISALPTTRIDYRENCSNDFEKLRAALSDSKRYATTSNITSIDTNIDGNKAKITVKSEFGATARYKLAVVVTENNIEAANTDGSLDGLYHHVAREFVTDPLGDLLNKVNLGEELTHEFEFTIADNWNVDEMEVTAIILKEEKINAYYANNAAVAPLK